MTCQKQLFSLQSSTHTGHIKNPTKTKFYIEYTCDIQQHIMNLSYNFNDLTQIDNY